MTMHGVIQRTPSGFPCDNRGGIYWNITHSFSIWDSETLHQNKQSLRKIPSQGMENGFTLTVGKWLSTAIGRF